MAGVRAGRTRELVVRTLTTTGKPMPTRRIQAWVCTPRSDIRSTPQEEFIGRTHVYQALCALERQGVLARLPGDGTRDPVWWRLVSAVEQEVTRPVELPPEVEPVDLDALQFELTQPGGG